MLTFDEFVKIPEDKIFATGVADDGPTGINMTSNQQKLRWVAVKGGIDWAIYAGYEHWSQETVRRSGDKITSGVTIRNLLECDDDTFNMYRK